MTTSRSRARRAPSSRAFRPTRAHRRISTTSPDATTASRLRGHTGYSRKGWCCRWVSNLRPLPYQGSALPLSYGSVPVAKSSPTRIKPLHEGPSAGKVSWTRGGNWACDLGGYTRRWATRSRQKGRRFRCFLSLSSVRIPLIREAAFVVPRTRRLTPNRLIRHRFRDMVPGISSVQWRFSLFLVRARSAKIVGAGPPTA